MAFEITVPRLGWSMEEGIFLGWLKKDGEQVNSGEPLFTLESEKAAQEVEATDSGILRIAPGAPEPGGTVLVGALLGYLAAEGEDVSQLGSNIQLPTSNIQHPTPEPEPLPRSAAVVSASERPSGGIAVSPRAARTALALGIELTKLRGTGRTGRIRERDVLAAATKADRNDRDMRVPSEISHSDLPGRAMPISPTRRTIARRMSAGVHEAAPVTLSTRADATNLVLARERMKAAAGSGEPVPSLNDIFVKLAAAALQKHPSLNAQWRQDAIFFPDHINIAIAIDADGGLLAPVIRDVPTLTLDQVAAASRALIEAARAGRLSGEQLQGGTFTITNLGSLGIEAFTPIINLPQCAILGVGRIMREPAVVQDQIVPRDVVALSLTFDHRVVDGAPAARFLATLRQHVESPGPFLNP